jgi:hypothetical protein
MAETKNTFVAGKMNQDVDERLLPDGQYRSASNITIESTGGSNMGAVQNARGNTFMFSPSDLLMSMNINITNPKTIGAVAYEPLGLIYWFISADNFDGIFEFNQNTEISSLILGSTTGQLNFDSSALITGVNYLHSDSGGYLFWTDNLNPPRRINISRVRGYSINDSRINIDIDVVLRPPLNSPSIRLSNDTDSIESNNLEEKFLYFSYRYKYIDNEFSSMSPFSSVAFNSKGLSFDPTTGDNIGMLNENNVVNIQFETGNEFVKEIQILARDTRSLNVVIIETLNKTDLNIQDNRTSEFVFRNNKIYATLTSDQVTRLFDNVPLKALAQDIAGNRLVYGNYTQFRDVSDISYTVDYTNLSGFVASVGLPKRTFRSDRDYEVGIVYSDEYGRLTTVLTPSTGNSLNNSTNSVYIPPTKSSTPNSLITRITNLAPSWATNYRLYIKQSKKDYYNFFPISFQVKGEYRYIQISESDRDKVSVGEYIIFKTANTQPTHTNRKFKVLEVELKAANDINTPSPAGLYLKIKPDAISAASFLAAPVLITTNSPSWVTAGQFPYSTCFSNPADTTKYPFCFPSVSFFYDRIHYRAGSNNFSASQNNAPDITLATLGASNFFCYQNDVRLKIKIVNDPNDPNGNSPTHFIINSDPLNQSTWTQPTAIGPGYDVSTIVISYGGGTTFLTFGTGVYVLGDIYVLNVRGFRATQSSYAIRNPISGDGIPASSTQPTPFSSNPQACNLSFDASVSHLDYYGKLMVGFKGPIYPGAIIKIKVIDRDGSVLNTTLPTSSRLYPTFEEYWYEECNGNFPITIKADGTTAGTSAAFRFVTTPVPDALPVGPDGQSYVVSAPNPINGMLPDTSTYMSALFISAFCDRDGNCNRTSSFISGTLQQAEAPTYIVETVPLDVETPIFHETMRTYPIVGGFHKVGWQYSSNTEPSPLQYVLQSSYFHYFQVGQSITINSIPGTVTNVFNGNAIQVLMLSAIPAGAGTVLMEGEVDQSSSSAASVILNNISENTDFNAFCYGNGLESYRIRDSFNNSTMKYSIRASTVIEDYEQEDKFASLTYSGIFRGDSSINRLNEFNLSLANFKNLDKEYGSVQKIYTRDSDLLVLHQDKITSVLFGKNLLVDALGGGQVASIPEVLGNQVPYPLDNGISNDPSSFAVNSGNLYFTDAKRGVVLEMMNEQNIIEISSNGMKNAFRDILTTNVNTQKIGAYDPYHKMYTLTTNGESNEPCYLNISSLSTNLAWDGFQQYNIELFDISSNSGWTIQLIDTGHGTDWLTLNFYSGTGNSSIMGNVSIISGVLPRNMIVRVSYCGFTVNHTVTQTKITPIEDTSIIIKN